MASPTPASRGAGGATVASSASAASRQLAPLSTSPADAAVQSTADPFQAASLRRSSFAYGPMVSERPVFESTAASDRVSRWL